ncbi:MAG: transposase [Microbacterium sp.]
MCDGQARTLAFVLTGGQVADTSMFTDVLDEIHVSGRGHARTRPDRVLADKGYPSKKNRAWLSERGIKSTIPERADQIANRRKRPGRPIDFGDEQKERQGSQRRRAVLQLHQAVARARVPIRQDGLFIRSRAPPPQPCNGFSNTVQR